MKAHSTSRALFSAAAGFLFLMATALCGDPSAAGGYTAPKACHGFEQNKGQVADQHGNARDDIQFIYESGSFRIHLLRSSLSYELVTEEYPENTSSEYRGPFSGGGIASERKTALRIHRVDLAFEGCNRMPRLETGDRLPGYSNFFLAHTPEKGVVSVPLYGKVIYRDLYEGIDLALYENGEDRAFPVKYDFIVKPSADASLIRIRYKGASSLFVNEEGELNIVTSTGTIREQAPLCYAISENGTRRSVPCVFRLTDDVLTFDVEGRRNDEILLIDPGLVWSTYFGGSIYEGFRAIASDAAGFIYVCGHGGAAGLATSGAHQTVSGGDRDAFLAKFSPAGSRIWATYYGGAGWDMAKCISIAANGHVVIGGDTESSVGIATIGSVQTMYGANGDGFIARFDSSGARVFGTYIGGTAWDGINAVSTFGSTAIYFTGNTQSTSPGLVTAGCHQPAIGGGQDALLGRLSFDGQTKTWCTYIGGANEDIGRSCASDASGNPVVVGRTLSPTGMTTAGAHKTTLLGLTDGFIEKFTSTGARSWGSYFGGIEEDGLIDVDLDASGNIYVCGYAFSSSGIATSGAYKQTNPSNDHLAVFAKFNSAGALQWGTYFGAGISDAYALDVVPGGIAICGLTNSATEIALPGAFQQAYGGGTSDAFLLWCSLSGTPAWSTYYGGSGVENGHDVAVPTGGNASGNIFLAGDTFSSDLVMRSSFQPSHGGSLDGYIAVFRDVSISTGVINPLSFCPGQAISVPFTKTGTFDNGNIWRAELSDDTGGFASPLLIGMLMGTSSGSINGLIPASAGPGTGYRVRVTSSYPKAYGSPNGANLRIYDGNPRKLTWTAGVDDDWSKTGNWDNPCAVPTDSDAVTIPPGVRPPASIPQLTLSKLTLDNSGGTALGGNVVILDSLKLFNGILTLGNNHLTMSATGAISGGADNALVRTDLKGQLRRQGLGSVIHGTGLHFPVGSDSGQYSPVTISNIGTADEFRVQVIDGVTTTGSTGGTPISSHVVGKTWRISEAVSGGSSLRLDFGWNGNQERAAFDRTAAVVARHDGTKWARVNSPSPAGGSNPYSIRLANFTQTGTFAIGDTLSSLPVELSAFTASIAPGGVLLRWSTEWERGSAGFEIQRSHEGGAFGAVGFVRSSHSNGGSYEFLDAAVKAGLWTYRLRQLDADGSSAFSHEVTVLAASPEHSLLVAYPNPARGRISVGFAFPPEGEVMMRDMLGREVLRCQPENESVMDLNVAGVAAGLYRIEAVVAGRTVTAMVRVLK